MGGALIVSDWEVVEWYREPYLGPAEIESFASANIPGHEISISPSSLFGSCVLTQRMRRGVESRFYFVNLGILELPLRPIASEVVQFSACWVFVDGYLTVVGFCFIGDWCCSWWWVWDLGTLAQFQGSEMRMRGWSKILSFGFVFAVNQEN